MRALLDTHTFLWWIAGGQRLSDRARQVMADASNQLFLSAASGWEIAIKTQLGKLTLPAAAEQFVPEQLAANHIEVLPIALSHGLHVATLPGPHRDPFDRMLVAQSQLENLPIITGDRRLGDYRVEVIW